MGEDVVSQVVAGGIGIGLVGIAIRQLWPILELNRQAAIDWKDERKELHQRIGKLEVRLDEAEEKADDAKREALSAARRADECEKREEHQLARLRGLEREVEELRR